jgi:hypothetical protein
MRPQANCYAVCIGNEFTAKRVDVSLTSLLFSLHVSIGLPIRPRLRVSGRRPNRSKWRDQHGNAGFHVVLPAIANAGVAMRFPSPSSEMFPSAVHPQKVRVTFLR